MRSAFVGVLVLFAAAGAVAQGRDDGRAYTRQDLFVACLAGYVAATVPKGDTPEHDESLRLAAQVLAKVHKVCPAPSPQLTEKNFTDPEAFLNRWMLMVTRELVVMARQGDSQQMIAKWK